MNVLVGCEFSATVRDAFIKAGHDAWSCDILPTEGRAGNHLQGDVRWALEGNLHKFPDAVDIRTGRKPLFRRWDLFIVFPDCTYLCSSGLHWNKRRPGRAKKTREALAFVREMMDADVECIALENPQGCISTRIRPPDQYVQPYWFGEDASKKTGLWLKNLPLLQPTKMVPPRMVNGKPRWGNQTDSGQNKLTPSDDRWKDRSRTYPGVAKAMVKFWGRSYVQSV